MQTKIKLNCLLKNPKLNKYKRISIVSEIAQVLFGSDIHLPNSTKPLPFIFSCFALSIDGKLCYPDTLSGLDIAKANNNATDTERYIDLITLMFARTMSDAVIFSSNIFKKDSIRKKPSISIPELLDDRIKNSKKVNLTPIIFCRDLNSIDFNHSMMTDNDQEFFIFHYQPSLDLNIPDTFSIQNLSTFKKSETKRKYVVYIDDNFNQIFKVLYNIGISTILNESPYYHHKLLEEKLLNEIWLNYACSYIGGNVISLGDNQTSFETKNHPDTEILSLYHSGYNFLYSRQEIKYAN
jgi:riboflavin biosynthesis pyrimidine reductase